MEKVRENSHQIIKRYTFSELYIFVNSRNTSRLSYNSQNIDFFVIVLEKTTRQGNVVLDALYTIDFTVSYRIEDSCTKICVRNIFGNHLFQFHHFQIQGFYSLYYCNVWQVSLWDFDDIFTISLFWEYHQILIVANARFFGIEEKRLHGHEY